MKPLTTLVARRIADKYIPRRDSVTKPTVTAETIAALYEQVKLAEARWLEAKEVFEAQRGPAPDLESLMAALGIEPKPYRKGWDD